MQVDGGGTLRVDTANLNGLNSSTSRSPSSEDHARNRLLQVSSGSTGDDRNQQVQLRHKRTGSASSIDNPFRPDSALSAEVDRLLRSSRIVLEGDRIVMKIEDGTTPTDASDRTSKQNGNGNVTDTPDGQSEPVLLPKTLTTVESAPTPTATPVSKANGTGTGTDTGVTGVQSGVVECANGSAAHVPSSKAEIVRVERKSLAARSCRAA